MVQTLDLNRSHAFMSKHMSASLNIFSLGPEPEEHSSPASVSTLANFSCLFSRPRLDFTFVLSKFSRFLCVGLTLFQQEVSKTPRMPSQGMFHGNYVFLLLVTCNGIYKVTLPT